MLARQINILYVDDEKHNLEAFKSTFRRDYTIFIANSAEEAKNILNKEDIHILITDQRMPVKSGTELLSEAIKKYPDQIRIILTGYSDVKALIDAINRGHVYYYMEKPWDEVKLREVIDHGFKAFDLRRKEKELLSKIELLQKKLL
ncbi:MAG: Response regulator receiver protein [Bacteroidota bacterium]|jgi:response regulator RpfG family c-di-GMP phosphodiesterase|nr:Response regulator receiver protein [Bacteroidota bacterium]